ncbi:MAG: ComEA family DNA-binding protein [Myxococcales bacterium]|jgi:competence protein ComEA
MKVAVAVALLLLALQGASAMAVEPGARPLDQGPPTEEQDSRININEASVDQLVRLPGIGPSRAEAIIAEREKRRFRRIEDILRVPGIGRKTFGRIRHSIRVR